jgi:glutathionyl-hydroquinone reductase
MPIPAVVVRSARQLWRCQWLQLMQGLGPADRDGHYRRPQPAVAEPPPPPARANPGDHVLIVGRSCPWAHRAWLTWTLRGLAPAIELLVVEPDPEAGRWRFASPFEGCDTLAQLYRLGGCDPRARATVPLLWSRTQKRVLVSESARLIELLDRWPAPAEASASPWAVVTPEGSTSASPSPSAVAAVASPKAVESLEGLASPSLEGSASATALASTEATPWVASSPATSEPAAARTGEALGTPAASHPSPPDPAPENPALLDPAAVDQPPLDRAVLPPGALSPPERREAIQAWRERLQGSVNDGVYRCGLARSQAAYDAAEADLFATLQDLEEALGRQRAAGSAWLCGGPDPSLADICLFATLIRWEMVYAPLFGCGRQTLWFLPELWRWRARFYQLPGVAATCLPEAWRRDYFGALFPLHPSGIIPAGPDLATLVLSSPPQRADDQQQP